MRRGLQAGVLVGTWLMACVALACPDCPTARTVRGSLWCASSWTYVGMLLVPFLLVGAVSAWLYRVGLPGREPAPPPARRPEAEA